MTEPSISVEIDEIMARADELEDALPEAPTGSPHAVSEMDLDLRAAQQIGYSADSIRLYLEAAKRECLRMATSLRSAAVNYEESDEASELAVNTGLAVQPVALAMVDDTPTPAPAPTPRTPFDDGNPDYVDLTILAYQLEGPDQCADFDAFVIKWEQYVQAIRDWTYRFRPFQYWEGDTRTQVESSLEELRSWFIRYADQCQALADQARNSADAHRWILTEHPTYMEMQDINNLYDYGKERKNQKIMDDAIKQYEEAQEKSEQVIEEYKNRAELPLDPIDASLPPNSVAIEIDDDDDLDDGGSTAPGTGGVPGAGDDTDAEELSEALEDAFGDQPLPEEVLAGLGEPSLKPASLGGGGGGDIPGMPLQPATSAVGPGGQGPGGSIPRLGGGVPNLNGMRGMGMPMMPMMPPMGGAGQGNKDQKAKPNMQGEEALYEEKRPWTEAVIGNRRRRDAAEMKESK